MLDFSFTPAQEEYRAALRKIALETTDELTRGYAESLLLLLGHRREGELLRADLKRMGSEREEEIAALLSPPPSKLNTIIQLIEKARKTPPA